MQNISGFEVVTFSKTHNCKIINVREDIGKILLDNYKVVNKIKGIIKECELDIKYMKRKYPDIESESHSLNHSWVAKQNTLKNFKNILRTD